MNTALKFENDSKEMAEMENFNETERNLNKISISELCEISKKNDNEKFIEFLQELSLLAKDLGCCKCNLKMC